MAISDKTRKSLWARSGNRCAFCKIELVQSIEASTGTVIIGEECHIISAKKNGPRGNREYASDFDEYNNLILLCANDHKKVDELVETYTVETLFLVKGLHEEWVRSTLEKDPSAFANDKFNIKSLPKIVSGKNLLDLVNGAHLFNFELEELNTEEEAETIGGLFEVLKEYGDILSDMSFTDIAKVGLQLNEDLQNAERLGFSFFGIRRVMKMTDKDQGRENLYNALTLIAVRKDNPSIANGMLITQLPNKFKITL